MSANYPFEAGRNSLFIKLLEKMNNQLKKVSTLQERLPQTDNWADYHYNVRKLSRQVEYLHGFTVYICDEDAITLKRCEVFLEIEPRTQTRPLNIVARIHNFKAFPCALSFDTLVEMIHLTSRFMEIEENK